MHIEPFAPNSQELLVECREAGMGVAMRCWFSGAALMLLMLLVPSALTGVAGALLTHVLAIGVLASVLGIFAVMVSMWIPAHDELIRRKHVHPPKGVDVWQIALICRFSSASLLRATPPPRTRHR